MALTRSELPRSFGAFFGRFARPTPIQERAAPLLLEGKNVLVIAPTATGKTEAYAAPLAERFLGNPLRTRSVHTIFVAPTRALTNDLYRRLAPPMAALDIDFGRYTGEHKESSSGALPSFVVTTPEALDSLVSRRPEALASTRAVVVDELHILDGTPRGDQLRIVLHRLTGLARPDLQLAAASATVADPAALAARYLGKAEVVMELAGQRTIRARRFFGRDPKQVATHLEELARAGFRKILVFVNARQTVEALAAHLAKASPFRGAVFPHHGSLARAVRLRTEQRFLEAPAAVAVATLTLELGIDIGSVDYVLLCGVPPSVSSLLQRIGRGNRRSGQIRVGYASAHVFEDLLYRLMFERGVAGDLCAPGYAFRSSVLVQQALGIAGAEHFVTVERLQTILPETLRPSFPAPRLRAILDTLVERNLLEPPRHGRYVLADKAERWYEVGLLHSNIDDPGGLVVEDRLTGEQIGTVAYDYDEGELLHLGGQERRIQARIEDRLLTDFVPRAEPGRFPVVSIPPVSFALARAVAAKFGAADDEMLLMHLGDLTVLLHGLGTCGGFLLQKLLGVKGWLSPYALGSTQELSALPRPTVEDLRAEVTRWLKNLERTLAMGPYQKYLPHEERVRCVCEALELEALAQFLSKARLRVVPETPPPEARYLLTAHKDVPDS